MSVCLDRWVNRLKVQCTGMLSRSKPSNRQQGFAGPDLIPVSRAVALRDGAVDILVVLA